MKTACLCLLAALSGAAAAPLPVSVSSVQGLPAGPGAELGATLASDLADLPPLTLSAPDAAKFRIDARLVRTTGRTALVAKVTESALGRTLGEIAGGGADADPHGLAAVLGRRIARLVVQETGSTPPDWPDAVLALASDERAGADDEPLASGARPLAPGLHRITLSTFRRGKSLRAQFLLNVQPGQRYRTQYIEFVDGNVRVLWRDTATDALVTTGAVARWQEGPDRPLRETKPAALPSSLAGAQKTPLAPRAGMPVPVRAQPVVCGDVVVYAGGELAGSREPRAFSSAVQAFAAASGGWHLLRSLAMPWPPTAAVALDDRIYLFGGTDRSGQAIAYDLRRGWSEVFPLDAAEGAGVTAFEAAGKIYVTGGGPRTSASVVHVFEPNPNWLPSATIGVPIPRPAGFGLAGAPSPSAGAAPLRLTGTYPVPCDTTGVTLAADDGAVYLVGARGNPILGRDDSRIWRFDVHAHAFRVLTSNLGPCAFAGVATAAGKMYIAGGRAFYESPPGAGVSDPRAAGSAEWEWYFSDAVGIVQVIDTANGRAEKAIRLPHPNWHPSLAVLNGTIYLAGGYTDGGTPEPVSILEPGGSGWRSGPYLATGQNTRLIPFAGTLLAWNGASPEADLPAMMQLDPAGGAWTRLPDIPPLFASTRPVALGMRLYLFGRSKSAATLLSIDPLTGATRSYALPSDVHPGGDPVRGGDRLYVLSASPERLLYEFSAR